MTCSLIRFKVIFSSGDALPIIHSVKQTFGEIQVFFLLQTRRHKFARNNSDRKFKQNTWFQTLHMQKENLHDAPDLFDKRDSAAKTCFQLCCCTLLSLVFPTFMFKYCENTSNMAKCEKLFEQLYSAHFTLLLYKVSF